MLAQIEKNRNLSTLASTLGYACLDSIMRYSDPVTPDPNVLYESDLRKARGLATDEAQPFDRI
ncbi:hypothetical protein RugamoR57_03590 [Duganella caerulea]